MGGLVLIVAVRADQNTGHHGQRAKGGGDHITHHVAVVVLAGPDKAALAADDTGHDVIDQAVEIGDACGLELFPVLGIIHLLEDVLEGVVILLGNGVLGTEPEILFAFQCVVEAAAGKAVDGGILVVLPLQDTGTLKVVDRGGLPGAVVAGVDQLRPAGAGDAELGALVHVAVGVAGNGDGLCPVLDHRFDAVDHDRRAEHGAVQHGADGAVGALPHLVQVVFLHALGVGGDGGALDCHAILLVGKGGIHGHLILGGIPVGQAQIVVLGLQIHKGQDELLLDDLPEHTGHLVAIHLHQRRGHLDLFHNSFPFLCFKKYCDLRRHCQMLCREVRLY